MDQRQTKTLFVANLPWKFRWADLKNLFGEFGEVAYTKVVLDRETNRSKGFGFVEFVNEEDAARAQKEMNEKEVEGRQIKVDFAQVQMNRPEGQSRPERREEVEQDY